MEIKLLRNFWQETEPYEAYDLPHIYSHDQACHLGKPDRKKPNHPDYVPSIFLYKSDRG